MAVKVKISADKTDFDQKLDAVDKRLRTIGKGAMGSFTSGVGKMATGFVGAFLGVQAVKGFGRALADVISTSGRFEKLQTSFAALIGDGEKAKSLFEDIKVFEAVTPLGLEELMGASKQLLAFGVAANNVVPTLKMLGDISAAVNIPIGEMADLFGRNKTQGTLMTKDIREFTGRGIPMQQALAKRLGLSSDEAGIARLMEMVAAGKISANLMEAALHDLTSEGGKFFGQTEIASQTLEGKLSTLESAFNSLKATIGDTANGPTKDLAEGLTVVAQNFEAVLKYRKEAANFHAKESVRNASNGKGSWWDEIKWAGGAMLDTAGGYAKSIGSFFTGSKNASSIFADNATPDVSAEEAETRKQEEENIAIRRRQYLEDIQGIEDQTLFDRKSTEEQIVALREKQANLLKNNSYDLALKEAEKIAKLENKAWEDEQKKIDDAGKKKLSYEEEVRAIAEERYLRSMSREQQIAHLRRQEADALAQQDYDRARDLLRQRATIEDSTKKNPTMGVADSMRRVGGGGGYFAPQRIQEKTLSVAEQANKYLASIESGIKELQVPSNSWDELN